MRDTDDAASPLSFVVGSTTRESVVRHLADQPATTPELCDALPASQSGVYAATSDLESRDLVREGDAGWTLTVRGRLVADALSRWRGVDALLERHETYWKRHDSMALPERFRASLDVLADGEVVRASDADPMRVMRYVGDRIADATTLQVVSPVYAPGYSDALAAAAERTDPRLVLDRSIPEDVDDVEDGGVPPSTTIRVTDVSLALAVTDDAVLLSLPERDGSYDQRSEFVAESERALQWGRDLFEWYWRRATDVSL
jgi:predicted transcriptional regulator